MPGRAFPWSPGAAHTRRPPPWVVAVPLQLGVVDLPGGDLRGRPTRQTRRSAAGRPKRLRRAPVDRRRHLPEQVPTGVAGVGRAAESVLESTGEFHQHPVPRMVDGEHVSRFRSVENVGDADIAVPDVRVGGAPPTTRPPPRGRLHADLGVEQVSVARGPRPACAGRDRAPPVDPWTGHVGPGRSPETGAARPSGSPASGRWSRPVASSRPPAGCPAAGRGSRP